MTVHVECTDCGEEYEGSASDIPVVCRECGGYTESAVELGTPEETEDPEEEEGDG